MPEGPEVWILSKAINCYYNNDNTFAYGKHLFLREEHEDWSFGLGGKVRINNETNVLEKRTNGYATGKADYFDDLIVGLGVNWITATVEELFDVVDMMKRKHGRKNLGVVLLDQKLIAGIGVAWGSEICFQARLRPDVPIQNQNLDTLVHALLQVRVAIKSIYDIFLEEKKEANQLQDFINNWFDNLYGRRYSMLEVYQKGTKVAVSGRNWWVHN